MSFELLDRRRLEKLEARLDEIRRRYHLLLKEEDPVYVRWLSEIDDHVAEDLQLLEEYRESEIEQAYLLFSGMLSATEDDLDHEFDIFRDRVCEILRCKYLMVEHAMPDAACYFRVFDECPLVYLLVGDSWSRRISLDVAYRPFMPNDAMRAEKQVIKEKMEKKTFRVEVGKLYLGPSIFTAGTRSVLMTGMAEPIFATVTDINLIRVNIAFDDGRMAAVPLRALRMRICKLKKH